jgi:hypothetical protein
MDIIGSLAVIAFAGLIHASFQLSVSMLTLLSGHAIGAKTAHKRLLRLIGGFMAGVAVMTVLLVSFAALWFESSFKGNVPVLAWAVACGLLLSLGIAVWIFYYRREPGTSLWLPRSMARYLTGRTKAARFAAEAFGLGLTSVVAELLFILGPVIMAALVLTRLDPLWQLAGLGIYAFTSLLSLLIVAAIIGSGHSLSGIQRWRENNKGFLQFIAGCGLIILGFYVYVDQVTTVTVLAKGGL